MNPVILKDAQQSICMGAGISPASSMNSVPLMRHFGNLFSADGPGEPRLFVAKNSLGRPSGMLAGCTGTKGPVLPLQSWM